MILKNILKRAISTKPLTNTLPTYNFSSYLISKAANNKIIVTRVYGERYSLFVGYDETVEEFTNRVSSLFKDSNISVVSSQSLVSLEKGQFSIQNNDGWYQEIKNFPIIDALILQMVSFVEIGEMKVPEVVYGLEIAEHNLTNRINIPEYIEQGVVELNKDWQSGNIKQLLSFQNIRRYEQGPLYAQTGKQISNKLNQLEQKVLGNSIQTLLQMQKYDTNYRNVMLTKSSSSLMWKILLTMSVNWMFLFGVTYGKYGWDVGEPISYLTDLGVDLTAMLGVFRLDSQLKKRAEQEKRDIEQVRNFQAERRMNLWRVAYLSRKMLVD